MNWFRELFGGADKFGVQGSQDRSLAQAAIVMKLPGLSTLSVPGFEAQAGKSCGNCSWLSVALLDGDPDKGTCNYRWDQPRPSPLLGADRMRIVYLLDRACKHYDEG